MAYTRLAQVFPKAYRLNPPAPPAFLAPVTSQPTVVCAPSPPQRWRSFYVRSNVQPPVVASFVPRAEQRILAQSNHGPSGTRYLRTNVPPPVVAAPAFVPRAEMRVLATTVLGKTKTRYLRQHIAPLIPVPSPEWVTLADSNHGPARTQYQRTNVPAPLIPRPRPTQVVLVASNHGPTRAHYIRPKTAALRPNPRPVWVALAWSAHPPNRTRYQSTGVPPPLPQVGGPQFWPIKALRALSSHPATRTFRLKQNLAPVLPVPRPIDLNLAGSSHPTSRVRYQSTGVPPPIPAVGGPQFWPIRLLRASSAHPATRTIRIRQNLAPLIPVPRPVQTARTFSVFGKARSQRIATNILPVVGQVTVIPARLRVQLVPSTHATGRAGYLPRNVRAPLLPLPRPVQVVSAPGKPGPARTLYVVGKTSPLRPAPRPPDVNLAPSAHPTSRARYVNRNVLPPFILIPAPRPIQQTTGARADVVRFLLANGKRLAFVPPAPVVIGAGVELRSATLGPPGWTVRVGPPGWTVAEA